MALRDDAPERVADGRVEESVAVVEHVGEAARASSGWTLVRSTRSTSAEFSGFLDRNAAGRGGCFERGDDPGLLEVVDALPSLSTEVLQPALRSAQLRAGIPCRSKRGGMSLGCLGQVLREPVQCLRPARLVQFVSSLGRERSMIENEPRSATMVRERKRHECLLVVGIGLFPNERKGEAPRRIDFRVLPVQVERLPVGWLHRDAIPPSLANVEVDAGSGETRWPPPPAQLIGLRACRKHARPRRLQNPFQMKRQPRRIDRHAVIIRRSAQTSGARDRRARVFGNVT